MCKNVYEQGVSICKHRDATPSSLADLKDLMMYHYISYVSTFIKYHSLYVCTDHDIYIYIYHIAIYYISLWGNTLDGESMDEIFLIIYTYKEIIIFINRL